MTYRDDHEAALARVDALEKELADARADDADQAERIATLEANLAAAHRDRDRAQAELAALRPPPAAPVTPRAKPPVDSPGNSTRAVVIGLLGVVGIVAVVALIVAGSGDHRKVSVPPTTRAPQPRLTATPDPTSRLIDEAIARAATKLPGAHLAALTIDAIDETGVVHDEYQGRIAVQFERKQPVAEAPPPRPIGAPAPPRPLGDGYDCLALDRNGASWVELDGDLCHVVEIYPTHHVLVPPVCTPTAIWQLALRDGATRGAIAHLKYDGSWRFQILDARAGLDKRYADNCTR